MKKKKQIDENLRSELITAIEGFKAEILIEGKPTNIYCYLSGKDADALRKDITWTEKSPSNRYKIGTLGKYNVKGVLRFIVMIAPELQESKFCAYDADEQISDPRKNVMDRIREQLAAEASNVINYNKENDDGASG